MELAKDVGKSSITMREIESALASGNFEQAIELADTLKSEKDYVFSWLVGELVERGNLDRAAATVRKIDRPRNRVFSACDVARAAFRAKEKEVATTTLEETVVWVDDGQLIQGLINIAEVYNEAGDRDRVAELLSRVLRKVNLNYSDAGGYYRSEIAIGYVQAGHVNRGVEVARTIVDKDSTGVSRILRDRAISVLLTRCGVVPG